MPFPYRAMLAIANDVDEASWSDFVVLHEFLNTDRRNALGAGLDLEVGDSFFLYATASPAKTSTFSYFDWQQTETPAAWAGQMRLLIDSGHLDSLHSWGEFSRTGGFTRAHAQRGAKVLQSVARPVRVWINHGDARNEQMAGRPGWDDPAAPHGHADITLNCGLRYFWTGTITSIVGQEAVDTWYTRLRPNRILEDLVYPTRRTLVHQHGLAQFFRNRIMVPATVGGREVQVFQRYGFWDKPTAIDLAPLLSSAVLDELERRRGFLALYTHLFRRPAGMPLAQVDWSPLVHLAARHRAARIKVTTLSRMLTYAETRSRLRWQVRRSASDTVIQVDPSVTASDLQGITFYVPAGSPAAVVVGNEPLAVDRNPADETGRESVSVSWPALRYPRDIHAIAA